MNSVLDASALIAFLYGEPGADVVRALLGAVGTTCSAHAIQVCEVFYDAYRRGGEAAAQEALDQIIAAEVSIANDMDDTLWQEAGRLKAIYRRISLADCFGLALARRLGAEFVTADHHEFDALVPLGLCSIRFIR